MIAERPGDGAVGALARCVDCTAAEFADRHWGRRPRLTRAAQLTGSFTDLLDPAAVDELVSRRGLRTPFLRMAKEGTVLPAARFTRSGGAGATIADQVADDRVLATMADGATLVLQALHRTWPPLVEFGSALAGEVGHPVQINAYVTPPESRGFAAHYDVHDVFVLQVAGRKQWTIHDPVVTDPLEDQPWESARAAVAERAAQPPALEAVLEPGDALYLPRGTIHAARAMGETSLHLTVGVHPLTRFHLLRHLLDALQEEPELRTSLPMGTDLADPGVLAEHLARTVDAARDRLGTVPVTRVAEAVGADLMRLTRPEPIAPLVQLAAAEGAGPDTVVRLRRGTRFRLESDADALRIVLLDRSVDLPLAAGAAVKVLLAGEPVRPRDLPGPTTDADSTDTAESAVALVRRLLREGVVVPA